MRILSLSVENFKSFEKIESLEFSDINVFIGPNNSGKTSLLHAVMAPLGFWREGLRKSADSGFIKLRINSISPKITPELRDKDADLDFDLTTNATSFIAKIEEGSRQFGINMFPNSRSFSSYVTMLSDRKTRNFGEQISSSALDFAIHNDNPTPNLVEYIASDDLDERVIFDKICKEILGFTINSNTVGNGKMPGKRISVHEKILIRDMGDGVSDIVSMAVFLALEKDKVFVIDQLETNLHPTAIKKMCKYIKSSAQERNNQFFIATHSHILLTSLASHLKTKIFHINSVDKEKAFTTSTVNPIQNVPADRILVLRDLGYSLSDLDLFEGWLILEESSAETIINFIITNAFPKLKRLRTVSANGNNRVEAIFDDFLRVFLFQHLEQSYRNRAWILIDGDERGKAIIEKFKTKFDAWPKDHFRCLTKEAIEFYFPPDFAARGAELLKIKDEKERRAAKKKLIEELEIELTRDPTRGIRALRESASEIFDFLEEIQKTLFPEAAS